MTLAQNATLGVLTLLATEGPEPDSDSGWNRDINYAITRALGSQTDTALQMSLGSHTRGFNMFFTRARFLAVKALQGKTVTFTDWEGDARTVLVQSVQRNGGRPFIYRTSINLLEQ